MQTSYKLSEVLLARPAAGEHPMLLKGDPGLTWRVLGLMNIFRLLVAILLLLLHAFSSPAVVGAAQPHLFVATCMAWLVFGAGNAVATQRRWPGLGAQLAIQMLADIAAVVVLMHASGGVRSGLGSLLVISIGAASIVLPRRFAVLTAAVAAIAVLGQQTFGQLTGVTTSDEYLPTGVLGAILFAIALAAYPISRRIRETEALAAQRGVDLANLAALNEYIIQNLRESIVVVDEEDRIRLINESAARHLGVPPGSRGQRLAEVSPRLEEILEDWRGGWQQTQQPEPHFVAADGSTLINPHFAAMGASERGPMLIFLEDASLLTERVQQSKLAALGRLSASIAHEIRNPVGAMSHAGQLLAESGSLTSAERRLTEIIHDNADRVSTIIENVLQLSRRDTTQPERITLDAWLPEFLEDFASTKQLESDWVRLERAPGETEVRIDPSHLEQILWNLCENALKYGCRDDGPPRIELRIGRMSQGGRPYLEVVDWGPGIDAQLADRVFEPFFTGKGGGTGLGLFISRELAECNRARLLYERTPQGESVFRVVFTDPQRWES